MNCERHELVHTCVQTTREFSTHTGVTSALAFHRIISPSSSRRGWCAERTSRPILGPSSRTASS